VYMHLLPIQKKVRQHFRVVANAALLEMVKAALSGSFANS